MKVSPDLCRLYAVLASQVGSGAMSRLSKNLSLTAAELIEAGLSDRGGGSTVPDDQDACEMHVMSRQLGSVCATYVHSQLPKPVKNTLSTDVTRVLAIAAPTALVFVRLAFSIKSRRSLP